MSFHSWDYLVVIIGADAFEYPSEGVKYHLRKIPSLHSGNKFLSLHSGNKFPLHCYTIKLLNSPNLNLMSFHSWDYLVVIIGADAFEYPGRHPFTDGSMIRNFPTANKLYSAIKMLDEDDLEKDVLVFQSSSFVDSRINQFMEAIDPQAQIVFLGDCEESIIAPRFVNKAPGQTQIRVYSPCCMSAVFIRSEYLKRLHQTTDSSSMLTLIKNNLSSGSTYGIRAFPPFIHCSPAKPHKKSVVNWEEVGERNCWNLNNYLLIGIIAVILLLIILCIVMYYHNKSKMPAQRVLIPYSDPPCPRQFPQSTCIQ